jgi:hypothetical protein
MHEALRSILNRVGQGRRELFLDMKKMALQYIEKAQYTEVKRTGEQYSKS